MWPSRGWGHSARKREHYPSPGGGARVRAGQQTGRAPAACSGRQWLSRPTAGSTASLWALPEIQIRLVCRRSAPLLNRGSRAVVSRGGLFVWRGDAGVVWAKAGEWGWMWLCEVFWKFLDVEVCLCRFWLKRKIVECFFNGVVDNFRVITRC